MIHLIVPSDQGLLENPGLIMPLAPLSISSWLKKNGIMNVKVTDLNHQVFLPQISVGDIVIVGFPTVHTKVSIGIAKSAKSFGAITAAAGPAVTHNTHGLPYFDHIIKGENETAILNLIKDIMKGQAKEVVYRGNYAQNLDQYGMPDRESIRAHWNDYNLRYNNRPAANIMTSRGCSFGCGFCHQSINNRTFRSNSAEHVLNELDYIRNEMGKTALIFYDDVFTFNTKRSLSIAQSMKERGYDFKYRATTRSDLLNKEVIKALAESGCTELCFGGECINDEVTKRAGTGKIWDVQKKAWKWCNDAGIGVKAYFIIGLPGQTVNDILRTLDAINELDFKDWDYYMYAPYPGTPFTTNPEKYGIKLKPGWDTMAHHANKSHDVPILFEHDRMSEDDMISMHELAQIRRGEYFARRSQ